MKQWIKIFRCLLGYSLFLASFVGLVGCGQVQDSGQNEKKRLELVDEAREKKQVLGYCTEHAATRPEQLDRFCSNFKNLQGSVFDAHYDALCVTQEITRFFLPACGWNRPDLTRPNQNASEQPDQEHQSKLAHHKVLKATDPHSEESSFDLLSAYALHVPQKKNDFLETIFFAFSHPQAFLEQFGVLPEKTVIESLPSTSGPDDFEDLTFSDKSLFQNFKKLNYYLSYELTDIPRTLAFTSKLYGVDLGGGLHVIFDFAVEPQTIGLDEEYKMDTIEAREHLALAFKDPHFDTVKIIVIERKKIFDHGAHENAFKLMEQHDFNRMDMLHQICKEKDH